MRRVLIVGAGIGGLAAGIGLRRAGWDVTVRERGAAGAVAGAGLSLFRNAFTALDALGVGDAVRAVAGDGTRLRAGQRRADGRWLSVTPAEAVRELRVVHRAALHRVLVEALGADVVEYGAAVGAVPAGFDLVVGADGLRSGVRGGFPGDPGIRYSGCTSWRGVTREPVDLLGGAGESLGRGERFGLAPLGDGRVYWFAVASMPAGVAFADEFAEVRRRFSGWHAPIGAVLDASDPGAVVRTDIHELAAPLASFRRGRTVLLGDAAHAMTPDLGQGAAQALEDAATLVRVLGEMPIDAALDAYDRERRRRTQPIAVAARRLGKLLQSRSPLRDAVLRAVPPGVAGRQLRALQAWENVAAGR